MTAKITYAQKQFLIEASRPEGKAVGNTNRTADALERLGMVEDMEARHGGYTIVWRPTSKGYAAINDPGGPAVTIQSISAMANETDVPIDLHDPLIVKVLWASMCAMVQDVHAPQDNLSEDEWEMAEHLFIQLDALVDEVAPSKPVTD